MEELHKNFKDFILKIVQSKRLYVLGQDLKHAVQNFKWVTGPLTLI